MDLLKSGLSGIGTNFLGKRFNKKLIILESDDWGTIRMSSPLAFKTLLNKGYPVDKCPYNSNDSLESNEDLEALFQILSSVKGSDGRPVALTANNIVANPDFDKIRGSGFKEYFYEPFTETLKRYPKHDKVLDLYALGIRSDIIRPQFHGREHLNVNRWLRALQSNSKPEHDAFNLSIFSPKINHNSNNKFEYMDALDYDGISEFKFQEIAISEGLDLFEKIWGFRSASFIAPCYIWHSNLEQTLSQHGVRHIQGIINQMQPKDEIGFSQTRKYHFQGQTNISGQRYFIRNVFFEPSINPKFNWEEDAMVRIQCAFYMKKPAIISTHRLNYIGSINPKNREENLYRLGKLLKKIIKKWPDVVFRFSDELDYNLLLE